MSKTLSFCFVVALIFVTGFCPARAATITWDLDDVVGGVGGFGDPATTFQGYFVYNTVTNAPNAGNFSDTLTDWKITVFENGSPLTTLQPGTGQSSFIAAAPGSPNAFSPMVRFSASDAEAGLTLISTSPFDIPLENVALVAGNITTIPSGNFSAGGSMGDVGPISGELSAQVSATPLPPSFILFATAIAGLGGAGWFRRRKALAA